jgi:hypothetical protein
MPVHQNFLLARINAAGIDSFLPRLSVVEFRAGQVIADTQQRVQSVYFVNRRGVPTPIGELSY